MDGNVHTLPPTQDNYYSDLSIWDIYRTEFPLLTFLAPSVARDIISSLVLMFQQGTVAVVKIMCISMCQDVCAISTNSSAGGVTGDGFEEQGRRQAA